MQYEFMENGIKGKRFTLSIYPKLQIQANNLLTGDGILNIPQAI